MAAPALGVGELAELEERGALVEFQIISELARGAVYNAHGFSLLGDSYDVGCSLFGRAAAIQAPRRLTPRR
jgi:hypothetical protein